MNQSELSSPIRIYWDLGLVPSGTVEYRKIAEELVDNKVLDVQLTETGPRLSPACFSVLDALKDNGIALSLAAIPSALDAPSIERLSSLPLRALLVSMRSADELGLLLEIKKQIQGRPSVGAAFMLDGDNYHEAPEVLAFCVQHKIASLVLPMQRLIADEEAFPVSRKERRELSAKLPTIDKTANLKLIVHDPFLWRAFFPSVEFPSGGCQAANTMLYISPTAGVYPCPSFPLKLGDLRTESLHAIIHSERKKELRAGLTRPPQACFACDEAGECKGGCRGRSYRKTRSLHTADPSCA